MTFIQPPENADDLFSIAGQRLPAFLSGNRARRVVSIGSDASAGRYPSGFSARLKSADESLGVQGRHRAEGDTEDLPYPGRFDSGHRAARQGFPPPPADHLDSIYRELSPAGHSALFIGEVDGRPWQRIWSPCSATPCTAGGAVSIPPGRPPTQCAGRCSLDDHQLGEDRGLSVAGLRRST